MHIAVENFIYIPCLGTYVPRNTFMSSLKVAIRGTLGLKLCYTVWICLLKIPSN